MDTNARTIKPRLLTVVLMAVAGTALSAAPLDCSPQKWDVSPISWRMDAASSEIRASGRNRFAWFNSTDYRRVTFSATVTPERRTGCDWSVLGLAVGTGDDEFWHIALVVTPTNLNSRHNCELTEMRKGQWLSNHSDNLKMKFHRFPGKWTFGKEYLLSISLDAEGVYGSVKDAAGNLIFESAYSFDDKPAVNYGRPAIHANGGFCGTIRRPAADLADPLPSRMVEGQTFSPYESDSFVPDVKAAATGFFRVVEINGKSWVVDPLGRGTVLFGVDHVSYNGHWSQRTKRSLYREWNEAHYPSREAWANETVSRLKAWGFNLLGAGNNALLEHHGLIHTRFLSMGDSLCWDELDDEFWICPNEHRPCSAFPNVFHPLFPGHCDHIAGKRCAPVKNDPWLFGYFIDNELAWWGRGARATGLFDAVMKKPASHTAKRALLSFVSDEIARRKLGDAPWDKMPRTTQDEIKRAFLRMAAEKYFSITSSAIRRHDPNHLVLGARFAGLGGADPVVWEVAGKYCDVVTFNCYPWADLDRNVVLLHGGGNAQRVADAFAERHAVVKKPMLITEWSFPALDSGLPCTSGAGQRFFTQKERTAATELFAKTMLSLPFLIGYDYFMWVDQPAAGISDAFPEDSNYGLVNEQGVPYPDITAMFTRLQRDMGRWRAAPLPAERPAPQRTGNMAAQLLARDYPRSDKVVFTSKGPAAGRLANSAGLVLDYGTPPNRRGMAVTLNGREIGDYCAMLHEALPNGGETWRDASKVTSAEFKDGALLVTFEQRGGNAFSITQRITVSPDRARFFAELVEVRNLGKNPITVKNFFFRAYAPYAGEVSSGKGVPNLWNGPCAAAWVAADGRWFGLRSTAATATNCHFFWDAARKSQHPDAMCAPINQLVLAPGQVYRPDEGTMWYEALCGIDGNDGWKRESDRTR